MDGTTSSFCCTRSLHTQIPLWEQLHNSHSQKGTQHMGRRAEPGEPSRRGGMQAVIDAGVLMSSQSLGALIRSELD